MNPSKTGGASLPLSLLSALLVCSCAPAPTQGDSMPQTSASSSRPVVALVAGAAIEARSGSNVSGAATFTEVDGRVNVLVTVAGASPGLHAVHVHETGDCSDAEAKSAGSHFNPDGPAHRHGAPGAAEHHAGDFGNMEVGADGSGKIELTTDKLSVKPGPRSVVGRAIIVHDKPDDFVTQPTGNAGGRIGCGVIHLKP